MPFHRLVLLAAGLVAAPALAQLQVGIKPSFSDDIGRQAVFNVQFPEAPSLRATAIDAESIASEFKRLCLDTGMEASKIEAAASQSPLELRRSSVRFLGDRSTQPFDIDGWHGPSADIRIWNGARDSFRKLPFYIVDSGVIITTPMKNLPPQCNLAVSSTQLADFNGLTAALTAALDGPPAKAKSGKRWGQARWNLAGSNGPVIVGLRVDDLNKPSQTLHLGVVRTAKVD